jgi:hypothetical protein
MPAKCSQFWTVGFKWILSSLRMMSRTAKRSNTAQQSSQVDGAVGLEELPQTAAAVIYQCLDARSRTSLAAVCRWARDLVLREVRSVKLQVHSTGPRKPLIRFINRVCSSSEAGRLSLSLEAHGFANVSRSNVLPDLLAPAKQQGGWASVKELALKVFGHMQCDQSRHLFHKIH